MGFHCSSHLPDARQQMNPRDSYSARSGAEVAGDAQIAHHLLFLRLPQRFHGAVLSEHRVHVLLDRYGLTATRCMRKVLGDGKALKDPTGFSAAGRLPENKRYGLGSTTPKEMVTLLEKLERG